MESNTIQFPTTREHVSRKVRTMADKKLDDMAEVVGCQRKPVESDVDFKKRVMKKINGPNR